MSSGSGMTLLVQYVRPFICLLINYNPVTIAYLTFIKVICDPVGMDDGGGKRTGLHITLAKTTPNVTGSYCNKTSLSNIT
jgi:hypothetical protein